MTLSAAADERRAIPASASAPGLTERIGHVAVHRDVTAVEAAWAMLEASAPASPYQTRAFLLPWLDTLGRASAQRPLFSIAYDARGEALGLLPLAIMNRGPLRLAEFCGGKDANFAFALIRAAAPLAAADLRHWLQETARLSPERIDLFALVNQPRAWNGVANPLRALGGQDSPAHGHATRLDRDPEAFLKARLSADARKKLRVKERHLAAMGRVAYVQARDVAAARAILATFREQKARRLRDMGVKNVFAEPGAYEFLERTACDFSHIGAGGIELHALMLDARIIAVYGGATHQGRFCGMFNSMEFDPAIARHSPGELLLSRLLVEKCRAGVTAFDLGVGEARYKTTWCETTEPLFDLYVPATVLGAVLGLMKSAKRHVKRGVKQSAFAWSLAERLRKLRR
jgi:CelD/BcsL family acetyltransferase involved in cellulose biosynthesis